MKLVHGGDWAGYRAEFGCDALDFSANVSPLGLPAGVAAAITNALPTADRYPDPLCRELRAALAGAEGVPADWILCGNGAADLIFRLALAVRPRRALLPAPTFAEYEAALQTVGCAVQRVFLREENEFAVTEEFIDAVTPETDIVFLCQPNNPTGQVTPPALVERLVRRCAECGAVLVVDECFTPGAVAAGLAAVRGGIIITDTNMALAGITKPGLARLGGQALCFMADPTVAAAAKADGTTRAVAAMHKAAREYPGAVLAVGNAPTALLTIAEEIEQGLRPALVIGVPVGFVNVVESKERLYATCAQYGVPAIVAMGRKGGSNVAAAICNALLYAAAEMLDPKARGWS